MYVCMYNSNSTFLEILIVCIQTSTLCLKSSFHNLYEMSC